MEIIPVVPGMLLNLGKTGTHLTRAFRFDIKQWKTDYPNGAVIILHKRAGGAEPYEVLNTDAGEDYIDWVITSADVSVVGVGACELVLTSGGNVAKSTTYTTLTEEPLGEASVPGLIMMNGDVCDNTDSTSPSIALKSLVIPQIDTDYLYFIVCHHDTKEAYNSNTITATRSEYHLLTYNGTSWADAVAKDSDDQASVGVSVVIRGNSLTVNLSAGYCTRVRVKLLRTKRR